jgi:23S rRNA (cytosine1962-C5)-methyltransferase
MLTRGDEPLDAAFFERRVAAALALRQTVVPRDTDMYRLLNGEGDFLPGFVVDVYGPVVVVQCFTAGAARLKPFVIERLRDALAPAGIYERSVGSVRREEGLEPQEAVVAGVVPAEPLRVRECGQVFLVDLRGGQKTGFFLDQRDNRVLARQLEQGRTVLNAFAYTGAFAVYAGAGQARHVVSVESSRRALDLARQNWACNGLPDAAAEFIEDDIFRYLRDTDRAFELLILDPPALVKRRQEVARGARAYKDLHLWAFRRATAGAYLMTFSCSQHVSPELFWKIVHGAAIDAGRAVQVLRHLGPGADHPVNLAHAEGEYLKGMLLRIA